MPDQEQRPKARPKLKKRTAEKDPEMTLETDLSRPTAKDNEFELDLDAATYQGKKGQAGTRTKANGGGGSPEATTRTDAFDL